MRRILAPRVFLDTNVLISAFWGSENCGKIIFAHRDEIIKAVISHQVLEECYRNIQKKFPHAVTDFTKMFTSYPPLIVKDPDKINSRIVNLVETKDQLIFYSAMTAKVNYFVTGNIKDFSVSKLEKLTGIRIVTPKQLVVILKL